MSTASSNADEVETLPDSVLDTGRAARATRGSATDRPIRVFVSSTFDDLRECRGVVRTALARLGLEDVAMETYTAEDMRPVDRCLEDVRSCDLYIGVFALRYGYVPAGYDKSITELEYRAAVAAGIDCLVFLLDEAAPWPSTSMDFGEQREWVLRLRRHLSTTHLCDFFSTPEELRTKVAEAVGRWMRTTGDIGAPAMAWDAWTAYKRRLVEEYGRLDLEALTPPEREEYLQISLRAVFVEPSLREDLPPAELPKDLMRKLQDATELAPADVPHGLDRQALERAQETYRKHPARDAFEALGSVGERTCVLLGDPGAGKSTLARYMMLALAEDDVRGPLEALRGWQPVLIELREYVASIERYETFLDYLDYRYRIDGLGLPADLLNAYLREQGRTVVVFDGLDELFDPRTREKVSRQIAGFAATYPDVRIVVTSRIVGYKPRVLREAGFSHYTIQDLTAEQRNTFLTSWYALAMHDRPAAAAQRQQRLTNAIEESAPIRELAGNPLLLTILAIIGKHQELPRERWKVYDHAASVLIQHWDINKHLVDYRFDVDAIREDDKKELLRRIAFRMQHGRHGLAGNHIWEEDLADEIEGYLRVRYLYDPGKASAVADAMIDQFRARNFVLARFGPKIYGFVHRALLEYFCAGEIVAQFEKTRKLTESDLTEGVFGQHWEDPAWTEVLRLIAGMVDATVASRIIDHLLADARPTRSPVVDNPSLGAVSTATQCLAEIRNIGAAAMTAQRVLTALITLIRAPNRSVDDERTARLNDTILPAIRSIGGAWPGRSVFLAYFRERGRYLAHRPEAQFAAQISAALSPTDEALRESLRDVAIGSASPVQRSAAITGLCQTSADDHRTRDLAYRLTSDPAESVRRAALEMCGIHWPAEPDTLTAMRHATSDPDGEVRVTALDGLIAASGAESETYTIVANLASGDVQASVRCGAIAAASKRWPDREETRSLLLTAARDAAWSVRQAAIKALASRWAHQPDVQALIHAALRDPDEDVRVAAVEAIASRSSTEPAARHTVCASFHDPDPKVRMAVVRAVASHWPDDDQATAVIRRAEGDPNGDVVLAALMLRDPHRASPETLASAVQGLVVDDVRADVRRAAVDAIGDDWYDFAGSREVVHRALGDPDSAVRVAATAALGRRWQSGPETFSSILAMSADVDPAVREEATRGLAALWTDRPTARAALHVASRSERWLAQQRAMEALAARWPEEADTQATLDCGSREAAGIVRQTAFEAIFSRWSAPERTKLLDIAMRDPHQATRQAAAETCAAALVDAWRQRSAVVEACADPAAPFRRAALLVLVTRWPSDPETWAVVARASNDADADVRHAALRAVLAHRDSRPEAYERVVAASRDSTGGIRRFALTALATTWPGDPAVDNAVLRGLRDEEADVRAAAVEVLTVRRPDADATRRVLGEASADGSWAVRSLAHQCLVARWRDRPESLAALVRATRADDQQARTAALSTLAIVWPEAPRTSAAMIRGSRDSSWSVRVHVLDLVRTRWPDTRRTARLVRRATRDLSVDVQVAAHELGGLDREMGLGRAPSLDELSALTRHPNAVQRRNALRMLVQRAPGEPETVAAANRMVTDDMSAVTREVALTVLGRGAVDDTPVPDSVIDATRHHAAWVRRSAVDALGVAWATRPAGRTALLRATGDIAADVRHAAISAVVQWFPDDPATLDVLLRACWDPSWTIRQLAAEKLRVHWSALPATRHNLELLARDTDFDVRRAAIQALATQWHDLPSVRALLDHAKRDPVWGVDGTVRGMIARSGHLTVPELDAVEAAVRDPDGTLRREALVTLDARAPDYAATRAAVLTGLRDGEPLVRYEAVRILAGRWSDEPETVDLLIAALDDPSADVRYQALFFLARGWPDSDALFTACLRVLGDRSPWLRGWVVDTAARWIDRRETRAALLTAALDDVPWVRERALSALATCWPWLGAVRAATEAVSCSPTDGLRSVAVRALAARSGQREDGDHASRIAAVEQMALHRSGDLDTYRRVVEAAVADECPGVRQAALGVLTARWPDRAPSQSAIRHAVEVDDPAIRRFLMDGAVLSIDPEARASSAVVNGLLSQSDEYIVNGAFEMLATMSPTVPAAVVAAADGPDGDQIYAFHRAWLSWRMAAEREA